MLDSVDDYFVPVFGQPKEQPKPKKAEEPDPEEEIAKEEKKKANEHPLKILDA